MTFYSQYLMKHDQQLLQHFTRAVQINQSFKKKCTIIAISWQIGPKDSMSDNQRSKERTCKTIIYLIQNEI